LTVFANPFGLTTQMHISRQPTWSRTPLTTTRRKRTRWPPRSWN